MRLSRKILAVLLASFMVVSLAACGESSSSSSTAASSTGTAAASTAAADKQESTDTAAADDGTLTIGYLDGWQGTFDMSGENYMVMGLIYDRLFMVDPETNELEGLLADSYEYVDDTHLKIKLNENAKFSNGDQVTSEDVIYSFQRRIDEQLGDTSLAEWIDFDNTTIESDTEFTIATYTAFPAGLYILASQTGGSITSKKFGESATADDWYNNPVGSGPYTVVSNQDSVGTTLELRDDYWNMDNLVTSAKTIDIKYYTSNNTMMLDYADGKLDMVIYADPAEYNKGLNGEYADTTAELKKVNDGCRVFITGENKLELGDINVRKAMSLALDTTAICDIVWGDIATPAESDFCSVMMYYESQGAHVYDPDEARKLMEEAGYSASNPLELYLIIDTGAESMQVATVLQQYWSECYINLTVEAKDVTVLIEGILTGGFDFMVYPGSGVGMGYPYELISHYDENGAPLEMMDYPDWLELRMKAITELDPDESEKLYKEVQEYIVGNYYSIPIAEKSMVILHNSKVKSIKTQGDYESFSLRYIVTD